MFKQKSTIFILTSLLFLSALNSASATAVSQKKDLVIVALTPIDQINIWSKDSTNLNQLKSSVNLALSSWKSAIGNRVSFQTKYIVSKPYSNLAKCDFKSDWKLAETATKNLKVKNYILIAVNLVGTCPNSGYALVGGQRIGIQKLDSTLIAHEIGHSLGFKHSGFVTCPDNDFSNLSSKCLVEQYGDKTDVMGSAMAQEDSILSKAQNHLTFKSQTSTQLKLGINKMPTSKIGIFQTKSGQLVLEYDPGTYNGGYKIGEHDRAGIQFRLINSAFFKKHATNIESGIGTLLLLKNIGLDENGNCPGSCYQDSRFHEGEKVDIPFSNIMVKILKVSDSIVEVQLLKNS